MFINSSNSFSATVYNWQLYANNSEGKYYYDDFAEATQTSYFPIKGNNEYFRRTDSILLPIKFEYNKTQTLVSKKIRYTSIVSVRRFECRGSYNHFIVSDTYFQVSPNFKSTEGLSTIERSRIYHTEFTLETDKELKKIVKKICLDFYPNGGKILEFNKNKIYKKIENITDIKNRTLVTYGAELEFKFLKDSVEVKETYGFFGKKLLDFKIKDGFIYIDPIKIGFTHQGPLTLSYALGFNKNGEINLWEKFDSQQYINTDLIFEDNRLSLQKSERKSYADLSIVAFDGRQSIAFKQNKIVIFRDKLNYYFSTYSFINNQIHFSAKNNEGRILDYAIELDNNAKNHHIWKVWVKDKSDQSWQQYVKNWRNDNTGGKTIKIDSKTLYR